MGCGASQPEVPAPAPEPPPLDAEALKKQKAAEEAAAINAQIAAKNAEKPVQASEPFKRKFDGFKRLENRDRHNIKRGGADQIDKAEVEGVRNKLAEVKARAVLKAQKTMSRLVSFGEGSSQNADGTLGQRISRSFTRRFSLSGRSLERKESHDPDEPQHGHGLTWAEWRSQGGGLKRALTRRFTFTRQSTRNNVGSTSKLFGSRPMEDGLGTYPDTDDAGTPPALDRSRSSKVKFNDSMAPAGAEVSSEGRHEAAKEGAGASLNA